MELSLDKWYRVLAPRPVVLVSTVDINGNSNAAPFSFVMPCSSKPPLITFASAPKHDTAKNIEATKEFVINIPSKQVIKKLWACAEKNPPGVSEIIKSGLTEEKSIKVKPPKIKECFAHFECILKDQFITGDHITFVGEVLFADALDEYFSDGKFLLDKAKTLMHIGGSEFSISGEVVKAK